MEEAGMGEKNSISNRRRRFFPRKPVDNSKRLAYNLNIRYGVW